MDRQIDLDGSSLCLLDSSASSQVDVACEIEVPEAHPPVPPETLNTIEIQQQLSNMEYIMLRIEAAAASILPVAASMAPQQIDVDGLALEVDAPRPKHARWSWESIQHARASKLWKGSVDSEEVERGWPLQRPRLEERRGQESLLFRRLLVQAGCF